MLLLPRLAKLREYQLVFVALAAGLGFVAWVLRYPLVVLFVAYLIAATLAPLVARAQAWGMPRILAIVLLYLCIAGAMFGALVPLTATLGAQGAQFLGHIETYAARLPAGFGNNLLSTFQNQLGQALAVTLSAVSFVVLAFTSFVAGAYLLYDWQRAHGGLLRLAGSKAPRLKHVLTRVQEELGAWVRGQLILSGLVGYLVFIALSLAGLPLALFLGTVAALFELVPYVGPIIAAAPGVLIGFQQSFTMALIVAGIYLAVQQAENHLLVPLIMRRATRLHPVAVIFAILSGFELMGIVGALVAVPLASAAWTALRALRERPAAHPPSR